MRIEAKNLVKIYGDRSVVNDISFYMDKGEVVCLLGPNGAGKTTAFNLLTGVYLPTDGTITLDGENLIGKGPAEICKSGVARTFQNIRLFAKMTVADNVKVALHNRIKYSLLSSIVHSPAYFKLEKEMDEKVIEILKVFELESFADVLASNLPYGKQRKLEIARALATNPKLLLLDEPAAGMNPTETAELLAIINQIRDQFGISVLLIEHDMSLVMKICERIQVIDYGVTIACGTPEEIANNPKVIEAYLGKDED